MGHLPWNHRTKVFSPEWWGLCVKHGSTATIFAGVYKNNLGVILAGKGGRGKEIDRGNKGFK